MPTKQEQARKWVNGYTVVGTGIVIAAVIPGSTSAALCAMEAHMCYQIGKIYLGDNYSLSEAKSVARAIGFAAITGKLIALEAPNFAPGLGTVAKAGVAGGVIKTLGEAIIKHYEKREALPEQLDETQTVSQPLVSPYVPPQRQVLPPPLPASNDGPQSRSPIEERLQKLSSLLRQKLISPDEYESRRQRMLDEL